MASLLASRKLIDLSLTLAEELPVTWPGNMYFQHKIWNWFQTVEAVWGQRIQGDSPYQTRYVIVDEHAGTHFDAPPHYVPPPGTGLPLAGELGHEYGDRVPLGDLLGPCAVLDSSHLRGETGGESPWIEVDQLLAWEETHGRLEATDIVLFRTDWDRYCVEGEEGLKYLYRPLVARDFPGWPAPTVEVVEALFTRGVRTIGIDAPSIGATHARRPAHEFGLSRGVRFVEGLTALGSLPARGAFFIFLPLKIKNSSGGPGRAVALV